jgi:Protein of unknown function (DUF1553)/Protein of unknown function (DUF1549)/Concanavalin A-like lectin/glucanases superfamily/Planctomycete cytochrome C
MRFATLSFLTLLGPAAIAAPDAVADQIEFNRDVRPIFSDKCYACHGPDAANRKTKLRFDVENGAKIELSGARISIVPGDAAKSEVFRRISSDNKGVRMPPAYLGRDKLSDREIEVIRKWIDQGAEWQPHWSFIPPKRAALPAVHDSNWPRNAIDDFVLARLEREGLKPSPEADRPTLIRRVTLDLTGLPPTPAEVDAFVNDSSAKFYEKLVDRLLASPEYAERMAFRWMEVARYGDTNGYQMDGKRDMWRWRDWVINAFAHNMPYDEFTIEQLAGDLLPNATLDQKIASGFNRNHRTNSEGGIVPEEFRVEYVADRAQTTSIVWLGLTFGCARCHDHKYDPIKQKDFYSLFAYFNSVPEKGLVYNWGNDEPLIQAPTPDEARQLKALDDKVAALAARYDSLAPSIGRARQAWERKIAGAPAATPWTVTAGLVYTQPAADKHDGHDEQFDGKRVIQAPDGKFANFNYLDPFSFAAWIKPDKPDGAILSHAEDYAEGSGHGLYLMDGKLRLHIIFRWTDIGMRVETVNPVKLHSWQHVAVTYDGSRYAAGVHMFIDGQPQQLKILFDDLNWPMDFKFPFRIGAGSGMNYEGSIRDVRVYKTCLTPQQVSTLPLDDSLSAIARLPRASRTAAQSEKLEEAFIEQGLPPAALEARRQWFDARDERQKFSNTLPTVMVMKDSPEPRQAFVLKRGAYDAPGDKVSPGVPSFLPPLKPEWPNNRIGLARWLVDPANPLTARVTVNRFWQSYFGTGLVKTIEDFGSQGEWPIHQDLLDWLAVEFSSDGWDVKAMQKLIVMSATYRQSSKVTPDLLQRDPENRLMARGPRLRLGPEVIRDEALAVSGLLVEKIGGPSVKPYQPSGLWQELGDGGGYVRGKGEDLYRRSLYTYWKRTVAPPFMVNFDSPSREVCTVRESRTNTPLQALNLMNDEAFLEASRKLAERVIKEGGPQPEARVRYLYRLVLSRDPRPQESQVVLQALNGFRTRFGQDAKAAADFVSYGDAARDPALDVPELAAYTAVSNLVLNLDAAVTKE